MTIIRPNSISGITSVTASGGDITYYKSDGTRGNQFTHNVSSTGIITATKFVGPVEGNVTAVDGTFSGNVSIAGTLTYEDVTNIDSVGLITARTGIKIGPIAGVAGTFYADGSYRTTGVITATTYYGSGAQLTGITGTTINNNADNRVITGSGTANTLEGEANLTYDGNNISQAIDASGEGLNLTAAGNHYPEIEFNANRSGANNTLGYVNAKWNNTAVSSISFNAGSDTSNKDDGYITFNTRASGAAEAERLRIDSSGRVLIGTTSPSTDSADTFCVASSGHTGITIRSGTSSKGKILFSDATSGGGQWDGYVQYEHANQLMRIGTAEAERLRIGPAGQIGIAGANYGSSGQAIVSGGSGASVSWGAPAAPSLGDSDNYSGSHICMGTNAGKYASSNYKICIGYHAGRYGTGRHNNVFIGVSAGEGNSDGTSSTGDSNVCIGDYAGQDLTSGSSNTLIGPNAGKDVTSGNSNVIIGYSAGNTANDIHGTVIMGPSSGYGLDESNYSVIIGHGASGEALQGNAADNQLYIARQGYGGGHSGTWIYGNSSGQCQQGGGSSSWYTGSDERYKNFLGKYSRGLAEINGLNVQNFKWKDKEDMPSIAFNYAGSYCGPEIDGKTRIGVGAQSCEALIPEAVNKLEPADLEKGGNHMLTLDNDPIFWAMVNAIQELSAKNDALTSRVTALES